MHAITLPRPRAPGASQLPRADSSLPGEAVRNRLNSTLPSIIQAASAVGGSSGGGSSDSSSSSGSGGTGGGTGAASANSGEAGLWQGIRARLARAMAQAAEAQGQPAAADPSSQFSVVSGPQGSARLLPLCGQVAGIGRFRVAFAHVPCPRTHVLSTDTSS